MEIKFGLRGLVNWALINLMNPPLSVFVPEPIFPSQINNKGLEW